MFSIFARVPSMSTRVLSNKIRHCCTYTKSPSDRRKIFIGDLGHTIAICIGATLGCVGGTKLATYYMNLPDKNIKKKIYGPNEYNPYDLSRGDYTGNGKDRTFEYYDDYIG